MLQQVRVGGCSCVGNSMVRGMVIYDALRAVHRDKIRLIGLPRIDFRRALEFCKTLRLEIPFFRLFGLVLRDTGLTRVLAAVEPET